MAGMWEAIVANDVCTLRPLGRNTLRVTRLFAIAGLSVAALATVPEQARSQDAAIRLAQQRYILPQRPKLEPAAAPVAPVDSTSALGQALAACDKDAATQETFALPGLKNEITLDRCYKGRAHLVCVFNALIAEAKSLTDSYTKIVDAKYPDINSVDGICQLNRDALATDINGSEDFTKRFSVLKAQYESASRCAGNVKQAFHDVVLSDMAQPPEILKSMTDSIDADINRVSQVQNQIGELSAKIEISKKAMKTIDKIHRTMCIKEPKDKSAPSG
jgi:hypothetical protein